MNVILWMLINTIIGHIVFGLTCKKKAKELKCRGITKSDLTRIDEVSTRALESTASRYGIAPRTFDLIINFLTRFAWELMIPVQMMLIDKMTGK